MTSKPRKPNKPTRMSPEEPQEPPGARQREEHQGPPGARQREEHQGPPGARQREEHQGPPGARQCEEARGQLQEAISGVMRAESQLRDNGREVRCEVRSSVSRQQEALRCREVWLLGQTDLMEQLKADALHHQLLHLHWLKGQFDIIAHQLESSAPNRGLANQLSSCLEKLSVLGLAPEEDPDLGFTADTRSLKQALTSFGRITTQHLDEAPAFSSSPCPAPQRAFIMQSGPAAPKKQKLESGSLSNWLLGSRPVTGPLIGYVSSKNPQDWLAPQKEGQPPCPPPAVCNVGVAWGHLMDLEAWLHRTPVARERTSSGGSTSSSSSSFSIEKIDESEFIMEEEAELDDWLITPAAAVATETEGESWKEAFGPFHEPWSSSQWLSSPCASCCQASAVAVEIENLGKLVCLKTPGPAPSGPTPSVSAPSPAPSSPSPSGPAPGPAPSTLEAWLLAAPPVQQGCRANEACGSWAACVSEQHCGRAALSSWLLRQDGLDKNGLPLDRPRPPKNAPPPRAALYHSDQEQKVQAILEAWLYPSKNSSSTSPPSTWVAAPGQEKHTSSSSPTSSSVPWESPFQRPLKADRWVVGPESESKGPRDQEEDQKEKQEEDQKEKQEEDQKEKQEEDQEEKQEDKWLLRKRSQQERLALPTVCDLFSCLKVGGDKDQWLHKAPIQM